jgi:hypothetical protein
MKKKTATTKQVKLSPFDFSSWNFIIFLTLAFVLIVAVALTISGQARDLSAKAGLSCPEIRQLPRPEDCPGGSWEFRRDSANGCVAFFCQTR